VTPLDQLRTQVAAAPQVLATLLPELIARLGDLPASPPLPAELAARCGAGAGDGGG